MPIPKLTDQPTAPRRLLRDVVHEKMFAAIVDGTLELGERLNDEELVAWLGVSRTPVREAIAKLADQGLVDIEANRYTRIVAPTIDEFVDTVRMGYRIWAILVEQGVAALDDESLEKVVAILERRLAAFEAGREEETVDIVDLENLLLDATNSNSLRRVWTTIGPRLLLVVRRAASRGVFPWEPGIAFTRALRDAVLARDSRAAGRLVAEQPEKFDEYFAEVARTGLYPA